VVDESHPACAQSGQSSWSPQLHLPRMRASVAVVFMHSPVAMQCMHSLLWSRTRTYPNSTQSTLTHAHTAFLLVPSLACLFCCEMCDTAAHRHGSHTVLQIDQRYATCSTSPTPSHSHPWLPRLHDLGVIDAAARIFYQVHTDRTVCWSEWTL
jgi:hypothetical protein